MKLTLFSCREYNFKGRDGSDIHGWSYAGWTEKNAPLEFSSQRGDIPVNQGATEYDAKLAAELKIMPVIFGGKVKYREEIKS